MKLTFLEESYRVLKKDGINIIATPSLDKIIETCYFKLKNKKHLIDFTKNFYDDEFINNSHIINLCFRAFGHRYIVDYDYMKNISKKLVFLLVKKSMLTKFLMNQ